MNHSHMGLWVAVFFLFGVSVFDCSGTQSQTKYRIDSMDTEIHDLKDKAEDSRQSIEVLTANQDRLEHRLKECESGK